MSEGAYEMLPVAYIRGWLRHYVHTGMAWRPRPGVTLAAIATHTGIVRNTLLWLALKETARMSPERQRLLSKTIAEIENGQIEFVMRGTRKVARRVAEPKVIARYGFAFGGASPRLVALGRPAPFRPMPSFKDALLT